MEAPFDRNFPALTQQEQRQLWESHVCVVGCGGLGGYIIEYLARVGVGRLTVVDGDRFEPLQPKPAAALYPAPAGFPKGRSRRSPDTLHPS